jgi:hypothetical protein
MTTRDPATSMAVKCPQCGTEFDVTLFRFDRGNCDCGAWVDLTSGHRTSVSTCVPDETALLAVCRNPYTRIMASFPGNASAAQRAIAEELRQADFELDEDNEELIARLPTILAVLNDGRSVHRRLSGEWVVLRDYG